MRIGITTGFTGYTEFVNGGGNYTTIGSLSLTNNNFYNIAWLPQPAIYASGANPYNYRYANQFGKNFIVGDEITYQNLTIMAGANYTALGRTNYGAYSSKTFTNGYGRAQVTPTVSVLYKLYPWITAYATYQQSLQNGSQVLNSGTTVYTNNGEILPPTLGQQFEFGAKATVANNMLLTAAFFSIDKANQYTQTNPGVPVTYTVIQSGRERHNGIELTATGKATDDLTIFGGVTLMDPRVTSNPTSPWQNGQLAQSVSPISAKIYTEYTIPYLASAPWLQGLTLIGGFRVVSQYAGALPSSYANIPYTLKMPGYSVGDVGLRYATKIYDTDVTLRFNVTNVANAAYWQVVGSEGPPRTFLASMQVKF